MAVRTEHQIGAWVENPGPDARVVIRDDLPIPSPSAEEVLIKLDCTGVW
jgi:propanol-preferring alcohol dehydrogenase